MEIAGLPPLRSAGCVLVQCYWFHNGVKELIKTPKWSVNLAITAAVGCSFEILHGFRVR